MPSEPPALRASHEDRDRTVEVLRIAAGDGRITAEELDARVETALSARTIDELTTLTADLAVSTVPPTPATLVIAQKGGKYEKTGRWVVPEHVEIRTKLVRVILDLTEAIVRTGVLHIDAEVGNGKLIVVTRPGIAIDAVGLELVFSKVKLAARTDADTTPRLRVEVTGSLKHSKLIERRR